MTRSTMSGVRIQPLFPFRITVLLPSLWPPGSRVPATAQDILRRLTLQVLDHAIHLGKGMREKAISPSRDVMSSKILQRK